ncbi:MAG TPA: ATP synthase F1 subunit gamma [Patescibacteria group bacterium]|jgi:F-type H+-transporting ATPase subunit gamma|nr:ATP synthase F1 subunit gamma [Patescibacteria group bacterium]
MATLLILKRRMRTASNVSKTTKAFQMISASKLKKAQNAAESSKPYVEKLDSISKALERRVDKDNLHQYMMSQTNVKAKLLVVISPDKGLCGGLVTNLLREVLHYNNNEKTYYITVGKKAERAVASLNKEVIASFPFGTSLPQFEMVFPIAKLVNEYFLNKKVAEVAILSTKFTSVFSQVPGFNTLLPVKLAETVEADKSVTLFEPNVDMLLPDLLQHYLEMVIYQSLLEAYASEQASRMIAMKNATDNAIDIISELRLEYNKTRQEKITNELLDIGGGQTAYE